MEENNRNQEEESNAQRQEMSSSPPEPEFEQAQSINTVFGIRKAVSPEENEEALRKLDLLKLQINRSIHEFSGKRSRYRGPAFIFKLLTTLLSAVVTLLLGLKGEIFDVEVLSNVAFGISAFITVFAFIQNFFDYYKLWTHYTYVSERLRVLEQEIQLYQEGNKQISLEQVGIFKEAYFAILKGAVDFLRKVRIEEEDGN